MIMRLHCVLDSANGRRAADERRRLLAALLVIASALGAAGVPADAAVARSVVVPPPAALQALNPRLPAPGALHYTTDIATCKQAGGDDGTCGAILWKNAVAFYFSWSCGTCVISGFELKDATRRTFNPGAVVRLGAADPLADAIDISSGRALFIETPPQGGWGGRCYVVTAFKQPGRKLISDGTGAVHPVGPPIGSFEESPPSAQACVGPLTREVELPAAAKRSYTRSYTLLQGHDNTVTDDPPRQTSWIYLGKTHFGQPGFSIVNRFHRAGAAFERSSLGDVTIHGGRFAYDAAKGCPTRFYSPAPSGWESAVWTKALGAPRPGAWGGSGMTHSQDVKDLVRGWRPPKRLTFFLMESLTEGLDAEAFNTDLGMMDPCDTTGDRVRLILDVGVTK